MDFENFWNWRLKICNTDVWEFLPSPFCQCCPRATTIRMSSCPLRSPALKVGLSLPPSLPPSLWYMPLHYLPVSLSNLQVSVGGQTLLQSTLQYGCEHFLEQVNLCEQLTSNDFGVSIGLFNKNYWEDSKWYYVNVERGNSADKFNGRNINVSFTNNSKVPVEVMIFIFYSGEITIDVKTGLVTRHKN